MSSLISRAAQLARKAKVPARGCSAAASQRNGALSPRYLRASLLQRSVSFQSRFFSVSSQNRSKHETPKDEPDLKKLTDDEYVAQQLPSELQAMKPTPPLVWIAIVVALGLVGAALPWKSFIDHVFYPPDDDDDD